MRKLILLIASLASTVAYARKPEDVFGGQAITSDKPFPLTAKSSEAYISAVQSQAKDKFQEDTDKKQWHVYYAAFFSAPVNDLELQLKIYDVTGSDKRLVESYEQYLDKQGLRSLVADIIMKRGDEESGYDANEKILLVLESKGKVVASANFYILGVATKHSGKVDFSKGDDDDDDNAAPPPKK
jgi:hypothetical protein